MMWIGSNCSTSGNYLTNFQSAALGDGAGVGSSQFKCCRNMVIVTINCRRRIPFPSVSFIHSSSSSSSRYSPSARHSYSQFYPEEGEEELGFKMHKDPNFLPNSPLETSLDEEELSFPDKSQRGFDFPNKPQLDTTTNIIGGNILKEQECEEVEDGKPTSEVDHLLMNRDKGAFLRRRHQRMKRSGMIAKQVISIHSALSIGFVSQLWVDTSSWTVLVVEVRPNLLSGELEKFSLQDIAKVGDVLLVENESVMENDYHLLGLETLVGYTVVTPGRRNIGKVRGYTFDINTGAIESLELDSFGISIIPSSLVSTYGLFVEDVLQVSRDKVVVDEAAAASRIQRLTKGFWGGVEKMGDSVVDDDDDKFSDDKYDDYGRRRKRSGKKLGREKVDAEWELPMDYL